jgi:hypothetical protein
MRGGVPSRSIGGMPDPATLALFAAATAALLLIPASG